MSNQRCPAIATVDEDELAGPSKQRVESRPQVSHGTAGGRLDRDTSSDDDEAYDRSVRTCTARVYVRMSTNAEPVILAVRVRSTRASVGEGLKERRGGGRRRDGRLAGK